MNQQVEIFVRLKYFPLSELTIVEIPPEVFEEYIESFYYIPDTERTSLNEYLDELLFDLLVKYHKNHE